MQRVDVIVVGAGPAGSTAATLLARQGRSVALLDKSRFPRDKCCGDGLTTGALRALEALGLEPSAVPSWHPVDSCWVRSPSGRQVAFPFASDGTHGAVARRSDLDAALVDLSRKAGAEVHEETAFDSLTWSPAGVTVRTGTGACLAARYLVAADGMWSPVRKALGLGTGTYLGEWHAFRQYLHAGGEGHRRLWVWFEKELLPGYAWSFPLPDGVVNVGFGIRRTPGTATRSMAEQWRRLLALPHIAAVIGDDPKPEAPHRAWPIPAGISHTSVSGAGGRVLFVGDAARAPDPMTGEGIGQAVQTGRLAAEVIDAAGPARPEVAAKGYEGALAREMALDHRLAAGLSAVLRSEAGARAAVRIAGASPWTRSNFARWLFEDYPRAMALTPGRWRRGAFSGPGAFRATASSVG